MLSSQARPHVHEFIWRSEGSSRGRLLRWLQEHHNISEAPDSLDNLCLFAFSTNQVPKVVEGGSQREFSLLPSIGSFCGFGQNQILFLPRRCIQPLSPSDSPRGKCEAPRWRHLVTYMTDSPDFILFVSEALTLGFIILAKTNKIPTHAPSFLQNQKKVSAVVCPLSLSLFNLYSLQAVECFPNTMPKDLPELLQKSKWTKPAKEVETWDQW